MATLADLDATELIRLYRNGAASPVEAIHDCLERIESLEPYINAVVTLRGEECVREAGASEARYRQGTARPLEGVPYGLKDVIYTEGVRTTGGSKIYGDLVPSESAVVVQRMAAAGGLMLAKLLAFEFGSGGSINTHFGPMPNPWDLRRTAGGSSSGSAAALAARYMPVTLGTDTGGSIRTPASFCGITGLKPTFGRVPRKGIMPLSWTLDHAGPMTRSVADNALVLGVIAGYDNRDPTSLKAPVHDYFDLFSGADIEGLKLGVPSDWFFAVCDPEIEAAARRAISVLEGAGVQVLEVSLPHMHLSEVIFWTIQFSECASLHERTLERLTDCDIGFAEQLVRSTFDSGMDYLHALRARHILQLDFEAAFKHVDAIISPGCPIAAPPMTTMLAELGNDHVPWLEVAVRCTAPYNLTGMPAITVPTGLNSKGLPMSISIAAKPLDEATCYSVSHLYQQLTTHHAMVPPLVNNDQSPGHN